MGTAGGSGVVGVVELVEAVGVAVVVVLASAVGVAVAGVVEDAGGELSRPSRIWSIECRAAPPSWMRCRASSTSSHTLIISSAATRLLV